MRSSANLMARISKPEAVIRDRKSPKAKIVTDHLTTKRSIYTVLYYKRKNKVHKSKGVSKLDGTLSVVLSPILSNTPISVTLRSTDTGDMVYRGGMRLNTKRIGTGGDHFHDDRDHSVLFGVDETISVGIYEVEILSCESSDTNVLMTENKDLLKALKNQNSVFTSRESLGCGGMNTRTCQSIGKLDVGRPNRKRRSGLGDSKHLIGTTRKLRMKPPFGICKKKKTSSVDSDNFFNGFVPKSLSPRSLLRRRETKPIITGLKTPILSRKTDTKKSSRANSNNVVSNTRHAKLPMSSKESVVTTTKNMNGDKHSCFPGAIGSLRVPNTIHKALRPHQIDGVVFLWNCLTGNGQVANLSPHIDVKNRNYTFDETKNSDIDMKEFFFTIGFSNIKDKLLSECPSNYSPKGCILSDEMGLGKTLMTIATISGLHRQNRANRFIVVCPSSLVNNWAREFDKWLGKVGLPKRVVVKKGGEEGLRQIKAFSTIKPTKISEVLILSYDLFRLKAAILKNVQKVALLVVDEGHRLKNTAGSRTMTALESLPCEARLCITATPIQNNLCDMYTIVNFVCPGVLGDIATFRKEYERPITAILSKRNNLNVDQIRQGKESCRILERIVQSLMLRRLQKDILDTMLPPRYVFLLFCRPTLRQRELYRKIANFHSSKVVVAAGNSSREALAALMRLRKICTHPNLSEHPQSDSDDYDEASGKVNCEESGKLSVLRDLLLEIQEQQPTDKVVIISNFTSTLSIIEDAILRRLKMSFLRLDGSISSGDRQSLVDSFNRADANMSFALTLSSKAGGVGLNLIGANRLIMVDPDWNPATDLQAMARIYREGQKKKCFIYRCFTSGTLEEVILQRQIQKGSLATSTLDRVHKENMTKKILNADELRDCFILKGEECVCDTKQKVVANWPEYDGKPSLISQGCQDTVLLAVAEKKSAKDSALSFVHIIKDGDVRAHKDAIQSENMKIKGDRDRDQRSKVKPEYDFGIKDQKIGNQSESSDSEYEFE